MALKIFWTPDAERSFQNILIYLEANLYTKRERKFYFKISKNFSFDQHLSQNI
jgi:hypothetical protein